MEMNFTRKLGKSGIVTSAMGLGCWAAGGAAWRPNEPASWGEINEQEILKAMKRAIDLGINFFDTADMYGAGSSEKMVGKAVAGRRSEMVIATKFGNTFDETTREITGIDVSRKGILKACENSLLRLNTDYIDLYLLHLGNLEVDRSEEVRETLEILIDEGKIRSFGWSTDSLERARKFAESPNCTAVENRLNVVEDSAQMIRFCEESDIASINKGPLAMGLLTGKYTTDTAISNDDVRSNPFWKRYFVDRKPNEEFLKIIDSIKEILTSGGRTLTQGSLAWIWAKSEMTIPIPGFKSIKQVEENASAMQFGPLDDDSMKEIDRLLGR